MLKRISYLLFLLQLVFLGISFGQMQSSQSDEEAIKSAIIDETNNWAKRDYERMKDAWIHDEHTLLTTASSYFYNESIGWDSIDTRIKNSIKNFPDPIKDNITWSAWNIRVNNNSASATFLQTRKGSDQIPFVSREVRFLEKKDGMWKFTYLNTVLKSDYQSQEAENDLNSAGYKLLGSNKIKDAIDIFKINVKLYPKSSNVYDSLGEAYMKNGDNELAVENYKKSLELDPNNKNAEEMISKLMTK